MHILNPASLLFLAYIFVILPWLVLSSLKKLQLASSQMSHQTHSWKSIWVSTFVQQCVLLFLAWLAGLGINFKIFAVTGLNLVNTLYALGALLVGFGISFICDKLESEEESQNISPTTIFVAQAPRSFTALIVLITSVAEEAAFRGVGFLLVLKLIGNPWLAALLCAVAFALGHWVQGWKNIVGIFAIALTFHALVAITNTLILAMIVHTVINLVAFYRNNRKFEKIRDIGSRGSRGSTDEHIASN